MTKFIFLAMIDKIIHKLNWRYDIWSDIEGCFPIGSKVSATITNVTRNYAFLSTPEGLTCFLDKRKVSSLWVVNDLTEELKQGETVVCSVVDYNHEKKSLTVSLNLN